MTSRPSAVLVCQPLLFNKPGAYRAILESAGMEVRFPRTGGTVLSEAQLAAELDGVTATIASTEPYTVAILQTAPGLRVISRTGVGYDSIDVGAATERGIVVACTPGTNHDAVAEHTFALLLAVAKRVVPYHAEVAQGGFRRKPSAALRGKTLGLVGLGRIGRAVARRAAAFDMRVLAHDPFLTAVLPDARGVELVPFDELLAQSDFISLHAAATDGTSRLICRESLAQMKQGVVILNTARGTLIDEGALAEALQSGKVAAAGIDVFDREPPADSPLLSAPNVVLSPHIAGIDEQAFEDMVTMAAQTIADLYQRKWPAERLVNGSQLPQPWKWPA
ncbi:MAG TPA: phosphoglycerate dehydrogenase [Pirellulaceae bacterium]|nr:phosphoglycerate dehydrogenase [Pirellulaceae bacterium]